MKLIKLGVIAFGLISLTVGCKKGGVFCHKSDGNIVTEERSVTDFSQISLGFGADLEIVESNDYGLKIEGSQNLMEIIETEVKGNVLDIDVKKNKCMNNNSILKITVMLPMLNKLNISGSGDVVVPKMLTTDALDINISGSGDIAFDSLAVKQLDVNISGSGDLFLSTLDTADVQKVKISGSGEIKSFRMPAREVEINISGSGECQVYAIDKLDVNIAGSGDVVYKGQPIIEQDISGSGTIKPF